VESVVLSDNGFGSDWVIKNLKPNFDLNHICGREFATNSASLDVAPKGKLIDLSLGKIISFVIRNNS
jgi:hypothetical protein